MEILSTFLHELYTLLLNKYSIETSGAKTPRNRPFLSGHTESRLIHSSLDWPHSPSQMASRFHQPFFHSPLSRHTDGHTHRQTDRWYRLQLNSISTYILMI